MKGFILKELLAPTARRLGTASAGALVALGATNELASQIEIVVPALVAFTADLIFSYRSRN